MIEAIQSLLRLQEVDLQLHAAKQELASFGPGREAAAALRSSERAAVAESEKVLADLEHSHRELERELADVEVVLEKLNTQLYEVTSKHALEALQNELTRAEGQKSEREDKILELLESVDDVSGERDAARAAEADGVAAGEAEEAGFRAREQALAEEIARLEDSRSGLASGVEAAVVKAYDGSRRKRLPAVVRVEVKSCPVCRMGLGPQKLNEIAAAIVLVHCDSCDRILYGEKVAEAERALASES